MSFKRFQIGFDLHGNQQDPKANEVFFKFADLWKPQIRVSGGDNWNFVALRKGASQEERNESLEADYRAGKEWLERFRCTHFLEGNHDYRLWALLNTQGPLRDLASRCVGDAEALFTKLRCRRYPYDKRTGVLTLGHLKVIHGFAYGVNAARRQAQAYGSVLCGHGHGIQHVSIEGPDNRMGRMCGCLCKLDMDYVHANLASLIWRHGFVYGVVDEVKGTYHVFQAESVNGTWVLPSDVVTL